MKVIKKENVVYCDVDETLILHDLSQSEDHSDIIEVLDPLHDRTIPVVKHHAMIRLVKEERHRGSFIIVWSRGGYNWAANVVTALGLQDDVDLVMTKPLVYFDDIPIEQWLPYRVYLKPGTIYKK